MPRLSLAGSAALTSGRDAWRTREVAGVRSITLSDGPHGVRRLHKNTSLSFTQSLPATCFPTASALAATWDPDLLRRVGAAIGREARYRDVHVLLGPGVNLKRSPLCGRAFEYFSEDPLLSGELAIGFIDGVQSTGVGTSLKHFVCNETEVRRYGIDTIVDERALRELYLAPFEAAVTRARPATVMAAYNLLGGTHCTENRWLLTDVLRGEWGFDGVVVSDWGAIFDRVPAIAAGSDLQMPGTGPLASLWLLADVRAGRIAPGPVRRAARNVARLANGAWHGPAAEPDWAAQHAIAREAAAAATVLLRNDGVLPLPPQATVALIGDFAVKPRFQGSGSSRIETTRLDTLAESLSGCRHCSYHPGYERRGRVIRQGLIDEAVAAAIAADVAVVVVGLPEADEVEGVDRRHLRLPPAHDALVRAVAAAQPRTVVVLSNGAPVEMPWRDDVAAIVEGYLGGQAGGSALADVLTGAVDPGGRLAETFPAAGVDHPGVVIPVGPRRVAFTESLYVGYRHFDSAGVAPAFCFGHGLSYTTFAWSEPVLVPDPETGGVRVSLDVTNTGERSGSDVVQLYVHPIDPGALFRPEQALAGFAKVWLAPGATARVAIDVDQRAFSVWDVDAGAFVVEPGRYELRVAASSRDVRHRAIITIDGDVREPRPQPAQYRHPGTGYDLAGFELLLGRALPPDVPERRGSYTLDTALAEMHGMSGIVLRRIARIATRLSTGASHDPETAMTSDGIADQLTLRMLSSSSQGRMPPRLARAILAFANAGPVEGVLAWVRGATKLS